MNKNEKVLSCAGGAIITGASGAYAVSLVFNAAALSTIGVAFAATAAVANLAICGACLYVAARAIKSGKPAPKDRPNRDIEP
ncbi:hypothetical protein [Rhizorhapis sp. SPR117]|uniref:hypothetical protein n=1 Tax=Rhizorhapis sp. SPR117 TaxID=2912611 RepID=UPI001F253A19|nr:hypothetical protein [Rhizorhapis sp. SPR117]